MSVVTLAPTTSYREFTVAGTAPLAGGKLYTAQPGTTAGPAQAFPKATFSDSQGTIPNTNPVVLDSAGKANIWLLGSYSIALYDSAGVLIDSKLEWFSNTSSSGAGAAASTTFLFGDATVSTDNITILSANDPSAPDIYEISRLDDVVANNVHITPVTGTIMEAASFDLTGKGECIRLKKYATTNDWMRG